MNGSDPKQIARELLDEAHPALIGLSHWIHANPELGYQEVLASGWVTEWLTTAGFDVRTGVAGMPTAVVGSYGPGPFHVAVCVEYDALPAVGHACGHNVIAAAGVGAGLALAAVANELGLRVTVMGTPAEETGGGKIGLIKAGEFDGVHAAMMVHPWPQDEATPSIIAIRSMNVSYTGKEAHAAGFPHMGVNAADALVVAQTAIALLRQQLRSTDRVHGIVTKGGDAPNIIPARTEAQWMVRGTSVARLDDVTALVRRCFEAGALATGATLELQEEICYADVRHDVDLARLYQSNAEQLGRVFSAPGMPVSTDMGNVSYVVPTIHPMVGVDGNGAVNHQAAFAAACATPSADQAIFDGALAMAWTAIDAAQDAVLRDRLMTWRSDPAEVAMVSQAWMMPPVAGLAAVAFAPAPEPATAEVVDTLSEGALDLVAEAALDPDAGLAAEVDAAPDTEATVDATDIVEGAEQATDAAWATDADTEAAEDAVADDEPVDEATWTSEASDEAAEDAPLAELGTVAAALVVADAAWNGGAWDALSEDAPVVEALAVPEAIAEAEPVDGAAWATETWDSLAEDASAQPAAQADQVVETPLDPDAAWAADVDAVAQQMAAAGFLGAVAAAEPAAGPSPDDVVTDEVLFVGFDDAAADPVVEVVLLDTVDTVMDAHDLDAGADPVLDVWVTPEALGEWLATPAAVAAEADEAAPVAVAPAGAGWFDDEPPAAGAWFATDVPAPAPVAEAAPAPVAEAAAVEAAAPPEPETLAQLPATPFVAPVAARAAAPRLHDHDAWDRAFEDAAARIGWEEQFEAAIRERMTDEGMDRSEAIEDLASDLQEAADEGHDRGDATSDWPPQASELVSREHIEAEGFSFVAPEVSSPLEDLGEVWSRNGADHATQDLRLGLTPTPRRRAGVIDRRAPPFTRR